MSFKGDLSTIGLAEVFQMISMAGKEGTLVVQDAESRKCIYFGGDGVQLISTGRRKGLRIGDLLMRAGKISDFRLREVLENQKITKKLLGEALVDSGYVTEADIQEVVRSQIEEEIYDLFLWKKANFEFLEGPPAAEFQDADAKATRLAFDVNSLLLEALRRVDEWNIINSKIPGIDCVISFPSEIARKEEEEKTEGSLRRIFPLIDGQNTIGEILDSSGVTRFEGCKAVSMLIDRGAVRVLPAEEVADLGEHRLSDGRREKGFRLLKAAAAVAPNDAGLAVRHAKALEAEGQGPAAADEYRRAGTLLAAEGREEEARQHFEHALQLNPNDAAAKSAVTRIGLPLKPVTEHEEAVRKALSRRDYARARELCEAALREHPEDIESRLLLLRALHESGVRTGVEEHVKYLRANPPADPEQAERVRRKVLEYSSSSTPRGGMKLPGRGGARRVASIVTVLVLAAVIGGGYKFQLDAQKAFDQAAIRADLKAKDRDYTQALQVLEEFRSSPYRYSPTIKRQLEDKLDAIRKSRALDESTRASALDVQRQKLIETIQDRSKSVEKEFEEGDYRQALTNAEALNAFIQRAKSEEYVKSSAPFLQKVEGLHEQARIAKKKIDDVVDRIRDKRRAADQLVEQGKFRDANVIFKELLEKYPRYFSLDDVVFPLRIRARPDGTVVKDRRGMDLGDGVIRNGELVVRMRYKALPLDLSFTRKGYREKADVMVPFDAGETPEIVLDEKIGALTWRPFEKPVEWRAVRAGDLVCLASGQSLYCFAAGTAALVWRQGGHGKPISGPPVERGGKVYYLTDEKVLYVFDSAARKQIRIDLPREGTASPGVTDDGKFAAVGTRDRRLLWVDLVTREVRWERVIPARIVGEPIVQDGTVYWTDADGVLHGANGESELWTYGSGHVATPPTLAGSRLYVGLRENRVVAVDLSGKEVWFADTKGSTEAPPLVAGGTVYVSLAQGMIQAFPATDAGPWTWPAGGKSVLPIHGAPAIADGKLIIVSEDRLYALDATSGRFLWSYATSPSARFRASPIVVGTMAYIGGEGSLYVIELD